MLLEGLRKDFIPLLNQSRALRDEVKEALHPLLAQTAGVWHLIVHIVSVRVKSIVARGLISLVKT